MAIQEAPVPASYERNYCTEEEVELQASGLDIDFSTIWGGGFDTADVIQQEALRIEWLTQRYFFEVRHAESHDGGHRYLIPAYTPILEVEECYIRDDTTASLMDSLKIDACRIRRETYFPRGINAISLVYVAGYEEVPFHIQQATAIAVVLRALNADPDWLSTMTGGGIGASGERLTVGPVTMQEAGGGWMSFSTGRLNPLGEAYVYAVQQEQRIHFKTTTRKPLYPQEWRYIVETMMPASGRTYR